jgi:hypothetical protein
MNNFKVDYVSMDLCNLVTIQKLEKKEFYVDEETKQNIIELNRELEKENIFYNKKTFIKDYTESIKKEFYKPEKQDFYEKDEIKGDECEEEITEKEEAKNDCTNEKRKNNKYEKKKIQINFNKILKNETNNNNNQIIIVNNNQTTNKKFSFKYFYMIIIIPLLYTLILLNKKLI